MCCFWNRAGLGACRRGLAWIFPMYIGVIAINPFGCTQVRLFETVLELNMTRKGIKTFI